VAEGFCKSVSNCSGLWLIFSRLLKFLLQLLHLNETFLTHVHLLFHKQLLSTLFSDVGGVELLKLIFIVLEHFLLFLSCHTINFVILAKFVLSFSNTFRNGKLLAASVILRFTLATHHIFVVSVHSLHFSVNFAGNSAFV